MITVGCKMMQVAEFSCLKGKTFTSIINDEKDVLTFITTDGEVYTMFHNQDCCESVTIEDICGDLNDLIGNTILVAEEVVNIGKDNEGTWSFYKLDTIKGGVTIRWYGDSNGWYSETVDFYKVV